MHHLLARTTLRIASVGRDEADPLLAAVLGGEALEQLVRVRREADRERADLELLAAPSKTTTPARPRSATKLARRRRARARPRTRRVQEVEAVEEVERRLRHRAAARAS